VSAGAPSERPRLAVVKFASCDGCQLQLLNLEDELLALAERVELALFPEASSRCAPGPYDVALVEGSIATAHDLERIRAVRESARKLITIGACATAGGLQALRNGQDIEAWKARVYPRPDWIDALPTSTPIAEHVRVDYEIHGCPVDRRQVLRVLLRELLGAEPDLPGHPVCIECKRRGAVCVVVSRGEPCLGPVTRTGCGALCPVQGRDCYGCFGPADATNGPALARRFEMLGLAPGDVARRFRGITSTRRAFAEVADAFAQRGGADGGE
jgi:coenzyme F420-reducing hydrogenase gamma subunit